MHHTGEQRTSSGVVGGNLYEGASQEAPLAGEKIELSEQS